MENYAELSKKYIEARHKELDKLAKISPAEFHTLSINCADISVDRLNEWQSFLEHKDITKNTPVLYYFKITSNHKAKQIHKEVERRKFKSNNKNYRALARINKEQVEASGNILYVGKCNKDFFYRLKTHLGLGSKKVYALHLDFWAAQPGLQLKLYYATVDLKPDQLHYLEQMENVLHDHFKPVLGRAAH